MDAPPRAWLRPAVRTLTLAWLKSLTIRRDPVILSMVLLIPVLQVALFGYALRPLGGEVPVVVARADQQDQTVSELLRGSADSHLVADGLTREAALQKVRAREALIAIVVPSPAGESPAGKATDGGDRVTVYVDDSDPVRVNPALGKLETLYWRTLAESGGPVPEARIERLYNPQSRNDWIMTPGLSGVVVMISMLMLGALAIVRERERGTWEALLSTPVNAWEAMVGKALPYLALGLAQAALVIAGSRALFGLPLRGSLPAFGAFLAVYVFVHLMIGLTISAAARTQLQAVQGAVLFYLPSTLLSGFLFPVANMPGWAQRLAAFFPLTHYVDAVRGVMLRGVDARTTLASIPPVAALAVVSLVAGVVVFRRRL